MNLLKKHVIPAIDNFFNQSEYFFIGFSESVSNIFLILTFCINLILITFAYHPNDTLNSITISAIIFSLIYSFLLWKYHSLPIVLLAFILNLSIAITFSLTHPGYGFHYFLIPLSFFLITISSNKYVRAVYISIILIVFSFLEYSSIENHESLGLFLSAPYNTFSFLGSLVVSFWLFFQFRNRQQSHFTKYKLLLEQFKLSEKSKNLALNQFDTMNSSIEQLDWILKQKNSELQSYLDAIDVHIYSAVTDRDQVMIKVNKPMIDATGYSRDELLGASFNIFDSKYHPAEFFDKLHETVNNGETWRGEVKNKKKDGTHFWMDMIILPIKNHKGVIKYNLILALPITDRKILEEQQKEELDTLEKIAFQTSHKVRGPLARILGLTSLMEKELLHPNEIEFTINMIVKSAKELDTSTSELTQFISNNKRFNTIN